MQIHAIYYPQSRDINKTGFSSANSVTKYDFKIAFKGTATRVVIECVDSYASSSKRPINTKHSIERVVVLTAR